MAVRLQPWRRTDAGRRKYRKHRSTGKQHQHSNRRRAGLHACEFDVFAAAAISKTNGHPQLHETNKGPNRSRFGALFERIQRRSEVPCGWATTDAGQHFPGNPTGSIIANIRQKKEIARNLFAAGCRAAAAVRPFEELETTADGQSRCPGERLAAQKAEQSGQQGRTCQRSLDGRCCAKKLGYCA